jgi:hypothetical protein
MHSWKNEKNQKQLTELKLFDTSYALNNDSGTIVRRFQRKREYFINFQKQPQNRRKSQRLNITMKTIDLSATIGNCCMSVGIVLYTGVIK